MRVFAGLVLANYLLRALLGVFMALPFAAVVGASGVGQFPAGDRVLFEPGGLHLVELLRLAGPELLGLGQGSLRLLVGAAVILIAARALTYATLAHPRDLGAVVSKALPLVPGYLLIAGLVLLAQALTLGFFVWLGVKLSDPLQASSEKRADLLLAAVALLGLLAVLVLGALGELARACLAARRSSAISAIFRGVELGQRFALRLLSRWAGLGAAGIALVLIAAKLTELFDVSRAGSFRPFGVLVLHQLVALALCALHTAWLRTALNTAQLETPEIASR